MRIVPHRPVTEGVGHRCFRVLRFGVAMKKKPLDDRGVPEWVWPPILRFRDYVEQERRLVELSSRGIFQISRSVPLVEALQKLNEGSTSSGEKDAEQNVADAEAATAPGDDQSEGPVEAAQRLAELAEAEITDDFRLLHGHSLVGIWGALEALTSDLAAEWLIQVPEALELPAFANLRIPIAEFERLERDERMRAVINELDRKTSATLRRGVNRFETILDAIGLSGRVDKPVSARLYELQQIRNAFVHRGGLVDRRLAEACPRLKLDPGSPVPVTDRDYGEYMTGALYYAATLANRIRTHYGAKPAKLGALRPVPKRRWARSRGAGPTAR